MDNLGEPGEPWKLISDHYVELLASNGPTPSGVGWGPRDRQMLRIAACLAPWNLAGKRVMDVGCGYGAGTQTVIDRGAINYIGIDLVPQSLQIARETWNRDSRVTFIQGNFLEDSLPATADIGFASGLLNTPVSHMEPQSLLSETLKSARRHLKIGFSFNVLRTPTSTMASELNTFALEDIRDSLESHTRRYAIDCVTLPYEITVHCLWESDVDYERSMFLQDLSSIWVH